jgi:hypothetical protein
LPRFLQKASRFQGNARRHSKREKGVCTLSTDERTKKEQGILEANRRLLMQPVMFKKTNF